MTPELSNCRFVGENYRDPPKSGLYGLQTPHPFIYLPTNRHLPGCCRLPWVEPQKKCRSWSPTNRHLDRLFAKGLWNCQCQFDGYRQPPPTSRSYGRPFDECRKPFPWVAGRRGAATGCEPTARACRSTRWGPWPIRRSSVPVSL